MRDTHSERLERAAHALEDFLDSLAPCEGAAELRLGEPIVLETSWADPGLPARGPGGPALPPISRPAPRSPAGHGLSAAQALQLARLAARADLRQKMRSLSLGLVERQLPLTGAALGHCALGSGATGRLLVAYNLTCWEASYSLSSRVLRWLGLPERRLARAEEALRQGPGILDQADRSAAPDAAAEALLLHGVLRPLVPFLLQHGRSREIRFGGKAPGGPGSGLWRRLLERSPLTFLGTPELWAFVAGPRVEDSRRGPLPGGQPDPGSPPGAPDPPGLPVPAARALQALLARPEFAVRPVLRRELRAALARAPRQASGLRDRAAGWLAFLEEGAAQGLQEPEGPAGQVPGAASGARPGDGAAAALDPGRGSVDAGGGPGRARRG